MSPEQLEVVAAMREAGKSYGQIARRLGKHKNTISWCCLVNGIDSPKASKLWTDGIKGPAEVIRGDYVLRRFTPEEDAELLRLEATGMSPAAIGRAIGRGRNSVVGRLATLARREERQAPR
jgi:DNA-binding CsgD family transcriptional regulator